MESPLRNISANFVTSPPALADVDGELMVISQFTLFGDVRRGKRPSFTAAMAPDTADNIMYSGWYAGLIAMYQSTSGDRRYNRCRQPFGNRINFRFASDSATAGK